MKAKEKVTNVIDLLEKDKEKLQKLVDENQQLLNIYKGFLDLLLEDEKNQTIPAPVSETKPSKPVKNTITWEYIKSMPRAALEIFIEEEDLGIDPDEYEDDETGDLRRRIANYLHVEIK